MKMHLFLRKWRFLARHMAARLSVVSGPAHKNHGITMVDDKGKDFQKFI